jgi:hypothetical protein
MKDKNEKQAMLRGGAAGMGEKGWKKEVKEVNMLMYFLHENEYRILKPVEITIRRGLK